MNTVPLGKPFNGVGSMLVDSPDQIVGYADVQSPIALAGEQIDVVGSFVAYLFKNEDVLNSRFRGNDS